MYFGARAVPQLASLGCALQTLDEATIGLNERLSALKHGHGETWQSTAYEILVAAALSRFGFTVEFLPTKQTKTPDLKAYLNPGEDVYVECKQKAAVTVYERNEAKWASGIFAALRSTLRAKSMSGIFELSLHLELKSIDQNTVFEACMSLLRRRSGTSWVYFPWGSARFTRLEKSASMTVTPLYSPHFLEAVFGWKPEMPISDGAIFQVDAPRSILSQRASNPCALYWSSVSPKARRNRNRAVAELFSDACNQMPDGSIGAVYISYNETKAPSLADERTNAVIEELHQWSHEARFLIPVTRVNRLYLAPIGHGGPDMIENSLDLRAEYATPDFCELFPCLVFTS